MSNFVEECKTDFVVDEEGGYGEQNLTFPSSRYPLFLVSGQARLHCLLRLAEFRETQKSRAGVHKSFANVSSTYLVVKGEEERNEEEQGVEHRMTGHSFRLWVSLTDKDSVVDN